MPFKYYKLVIQDLKKNQTQIYFDLDNQKNPLKNFGIVNYGLFLLEIINNLIVLDIALILMIFFQVDKKKLSAHRILTWIVLWTNIVNFLYYV